MKTHLFILGAGASLDFLNKEEFSDIELNNWQPPLSNKIFDTTRFFEILEKYPDSTELAAYINSKLRNKDRWLESILTDIRDNKSKSNALRKNQLVSMMFYLSDLFRQITLNYYKPVNNHKVLKEILHDNQIEAFFVNFNYDLLLEQSLGLSAKTIDEYLRFEFPVVKIHGAYNWFYERRVNSFNEQNSSYSLSLAGADYVLDNKKDYQIQIKDVPNLLHLGSSQIDAMTAISYHPALALPLNNKNHALCPDTHINFLKEQVRNVSKVTIIGWRAADPHLLDILKENLNPMAQIGIISGDNAESIVVPNIKKYLKNDTTIVDTKYSESLTNDTLEEFILS